MKLKKLYTNSFRNLEQTDLSFGDRFNIFFGNNAQGKTNLLESIYLLGTMKSFRLAKNSELIQWGAPHGLLQGMGGKGRGDQGNIPSAGKAGQKGTGGPEVGGEDWPIFSAASTWWSSRRKRWPW